jgi:hypothetical protein
MKGYEVPLSVIDSVYISHCKTILALYHWEDFTKTFSSAQLPFDQV